MNTLLEKKRCELGMSQPTLAKRSGVSPSTVCRVLSGDDRATLRNVRAVAGALGVAIEFSDQQSAESILDAHAEVKAKMLTRLSQGTSALEGQAVDQDTIARLVRQTVHELLAGPRRNLWAS